MDTEIPSDASESIYMSGWGSLQSYRAFLGAVGDLHAYESDDALVAEWQQKCARVWQLESEECGLADDPQYERLSEDEVQQDVVAQLRTEFEHTKVRRQWSFVDIDKTVVFQPHIDLAFVRDIQGQICGPLGVQDLVRISAGTWPAKSRIDALQVASDKYAFLSRSADIRFLGSALLDPTCISNCHVLGVPTHVVAIFIGSSINCVSAVHVSNRLILTNGSHRAYALRELGYTRIACLVTFAKSEEEKRSALPAEVRRDEYRYLGAKRPPLFKDYFDSSIRTVVRTNATQTLLQLKIEQSKMLIPNLG